VTDSTTEPSYADLLDKIRILESENQALTERAEELLLTGALFDLDAGDDERSSGVESPWRLVDRYLEHVAVLRGVDFVALCELEATQTAPNGARTVRQYSTMDDAPVQRVLLTEAAASSIQRGADGLTLADKRPAGELVLADGRTRSLAAVLVVPASCRLIPDGFLLLADTQAHGSVPGCRSLLARSVRMLVTRLDKLALLDALRELNGRLDALVEERTFELSRTNLELRASEERFRRLVEGAGDAFFVVSRRGEIVDASERACRGLGYERAELLGKPMSSFEVGIGREELTAVVERACSRSPGEGASTIMGVHRRRDGSSFPVEVRLTTVQPAAGGEAVVLALARDVSERRLLEAQLHQAQKMESIGRLAGGVAHDFNNMLSAILGYADLLQAELPEAGGYRESVQEIIAAGESAARLTKQLLAFSRRHALKKERVRLGDVVKDAARMLERIIGDDVHVLLRASPECVIEADPVQIEQIVLNLAVNARDAMPQGGELRIDVADATRADLEAERGRIPLGDYVLLSVTDTGTGMTPEVLEHVFEPFFTTKEPGKGTGLGLATVYGIVRQHGGSIAVSSQVGQGTTFRVLFPRGEATTQARVESLLPPESTRTGELVLVVDDNPRVQDVLRTGLTQLGYRVSAAANATEALAQLGRDQHDIVLTDIVMPGMNGLELAEAIRARHPRTRIVLMSGYADDSEALSRELERGALLLQKPIRLRALARTLRLVLSEPPVS
jgi:PAS domain S-box-containing protein